MKKETYAEKLNRMLGITAEVEVVKEKEKSRKGNIEGITEDEIQSFRAAQGILYFLQAPELFQAKVCPHCKASFLVSRLYVGYCSYTCIRKSLNEQGFEWRKGQDIESVINDVYEGNEPLWIKNLPLLKSKIDQAITLSQQAQSPSETHGSTLSTS